VSNPTTHGEAPKSPTPIELWERNTVLKFFGGDKPLHISTLYRGISTGIYPKPINTSGNSVRWLADECRAALDKMITARDEPPKRPTRRGRPCKHITPKN
jgi:predicted DNA-binding transcriptional regulator AlpA